MHPGVYPPAIVIMHRVIQRGDHGGSVNRRLAHHLADGGQTKLLERNGCADGVAGQSQVWNLAPVLRVECAER